MNPKTADALTAARTQAAQSFTLPNAKTKAVFNNGFRAGFTAGLDYQQGKIDTYKAYIAGKITLSELERMTQ